MNTRKLITGFAATITFLLGIYTLINTILNQKRDYEYREYQIKPHLHFNPETTDLSFKAKNDGPGHASVRRIVFASNTRHRCIDSAKIDRLRWYAESKSFLLKLPTIFWKQRMTNVVADCKKA